MKTFKQLVSESLTGYGHYKTHAMAYIKHANRAAKMEDEPGNHSEDAADDEWEKAEHHANQVATHHGAHIRTHMGETVTGKGDVEASWHSRPTK